MGVRDTSIARLALNEVNRALSLDDENLGLDNNNELETYDVTRNFVYIEPSQIVDGRVVEVVEGLLDEVSSDDELYISDLELEDDENNIIHESDNEEYDSDDEFRNNFMEALRERRRNRLNNN